MGESVSFGKYENDALSWEKWSTFSPNKYLEEVGKCSPPGSVAQKKAFFEAHYKKIAAIKAQLLTATEDSFQEIIKEDHRDEPKSKVCLNLEQLQAQIIIVDESEKSIHHNDESVVDESCNGLELQHPLPPLPLISNVDKLDEATSKSKHPSLSESRRITPTSLHLSMSMNSEYSDTASSVTSSRRRSLFMEQMGDKDIVKRAFKTFQNRVNQLPSSEGKSSGPKQLPTKRSEQKASTSMTNQKENERSRKATEKITPTRGQLGPTWKSVSSGSLKGVGVDERRKKATPTSVVLRSNERAEKRKEFFKNLEEKSNAREAERIQLSSKSKELKDAEMKNQCQVFIRHKGCRKALQKRTP